MPGVGGSHTVAAGQVGRGRSVFQQRLEHCVWSARNRKHLVKNYYRSRDGVHVGSTDAFAAGGDRLSFGLTIERAGSDAGTAAITRRECCTGRITGSFGGSDRFAERSEIVRKTQTR